MTRQATYLGKATKSPDDCLPVPEIPEPFHVGEVRVFTDDYLTALGVDPKQGDKWVENTFAIQNQNRDDQPLFLVESASKSKTEDKPPITDPPNVDTPRIEKPATKKSSSSGAKAGK